jgi:hypothetical protein
MKGGGTGYENEANEDERRTTTSERKMMSPYDFGVVIVEEESGDAARQRLCLYVVSGPTMTKEDCLEIIERL